MSEQIAYRHRDRKDGRFSPYINRTTSERIRKYCEAKNINKTKFVEQCITERLDALEREMYESMTKDELIAIILQKKER